MTTSMGHHLLLVMARNKEGILCVSTENAQKGHYHIPEDNIKLIVLMVEATDDSYIFATSWQTLEELVLEIECFQHTYNWTTQWKKSVYYALNDPEMEATDYTDVKSIDKEDLWNQAKTTTHRVAVNSTALDFLGATIDDSEVQTRELKDIIDRFQFPKLSTRLPLTLMRRMVNSTLLPRLRSLIALQPLMEKNAIEVETALIAKVMSNIRIGLYSPSREILTLPIEHWGFDFPSICRMNASIAVEGILRDLNHHIPAYATMARTTHADWTCTKISGCIDPLSWIGVDK
jgi:hypothetical protein